MVLVFLVCKYWINDVVVCCVILFVGWDVVVNGGKVCWEKGLFLNLVIVSFWGIFIFFICVLNNVFVVILLLYVNIVVGCGDMVSSVLEFFILVLNE